MKPNELPEETIQEMMAKLEAYYASIYRDIDPRGEVARMKRLATKIYNATRCVTAFITKDILLAAIQLVNKERIALPYVGYYHLIEAIEELGYNWAWQEFKTLLEFGNGRDMYLCELDHSCGNITLTKQ